MFPLRYHPASAMKESYVLRSFRSSRIGLPFGRFAAVFAVATFALFAGGLIGCGASFPPPTDRAAKAEAAVRGAQEVQAEGTPQAALHLKLAQEEIVKGKALMN